MMGGHRGSYFFSSIDKGQSLSAYTSGESFSQERLFGFPEGTYRGNAIKVVPGLPAHEDEKEGESSAKEMCLGWRRAGRTRRLKGVLNGGLVSAINGFWGLGFWLWLLSALETREANYHPKK